MHITLVIKIKSEALSLRTCPEAATAAGGRRAPHNWLDDLSLGRCVQLGRRRGRVAPGGHAQQAPIRPLYSLELI